MSQVLDIGLNHTIEFVEYQGETCGIIDNHLRPDGTPCSGSVMFTGRSWDRTFKGKTTTWEVVQEDPLTLSPSLLCRTCGDHGFIQNGQWVPA